MSDRIDYLHGIAKYHLGNSSDEGKAVIAAAAAIEKTALIMLEQAKALDKLLHDIERLRGAIEKALPNIHQENDREAYEILGQALKENDDAAIVESGVLE
jgi:hypothetical protein